MRRSLARRKTAADPATAGGAIFSARLSLLRFFGKTKK